MFTRPFHPDRFLRSVLGTEPFRDYCRQRRIVFEQGSSSPGVDAVRRWSAALAELPHEQHGQVELELATVNEMAGTEALTHLAEAVEGRTMPPDSVPRGIPVALWFLVHHPHLFYEIFFRHEVQEVRAWRTARAAKGLAIDDGKDRAAALTEVMRVFFRVHEGTGRFCTVEMQRLSHSICFVAQVADRLQFLDVFTESGKPARQKLRRAISVLFVYYPEDGTVLLKSHLRSAHRVAELLSRFGEVVLGSLVTSIDAAFDLERLKSPFHPLPDADDMELVRVKALHLRYPTRARRRQLKLETRSNDDPAAIEQLLLTHVADTTLEQLCVCHAELQVRLRVQGRPRNYLIRLWPNRCSLSQTALGDRFRSCLQRWGLTHAQ